MAATFLLLVTGFRRISTELVLLVPIYLPPRLAIGQPSGLKETLNQKTTLREFCFTAFQWQIVNREKREG